MSFWLIFTSTIFFKRWRQLQHHKLLSIFHPLNISHFDKHQTAVSKQRKLLVRDNTGINSACTSLLLFCLFLCLSLEKKIPQPPEYTHANGNNDVHLLGTGIHPLRTTLRSPSNMSHQRRVGYHGPLLCSSSSSLDLPTQGCPWHWNSRLSTTW